jgi:hypothetical protein
LIDVDGRKGEKEVVGRFCATPFLLEELLLALLGQGLNMRACTDRLGHPEPNSARYSPKVFTGPKIDQ